MFGTYCLNLVLGSAFATPVSSVSQAFGRTFPAGLFGV